MKLTIILHEIENEGYLCIKLADLTVLKSKRKTFTPPTIEEVKAYCESRKNGIDAALFIDYYQTRGWYLSKGVKMKDWNSAIHTWEKNNNYKSPLESKGTNLSDPPPEYFGVPSPNAVPMPDRMKKRISNIGKG